MPQPQNQPQLPDKDMAMAVSLIGFIILTPLSVLVSSKPMAFLAFVSAVTFSYLFINESK